MRLSEWLLAKSLIERLQKKKGVVLRIAPFLFLKLVRRVSTAVRVSIELINHCGRF